jgi:hypothetical protein
MKFPSKLALTIVAITAVGATIDTMAAFADPVIGSTAAAVSIKFQDPGTTNGSFSLNPNGAATSNVSGVKEISAAIATGETKATASSGSTGSGTSAYSEGYSQPVTFKFNTFGDVSTSATSTNNTGTNYDYAGSTAGLSFIPVVK